MVECMLAVTSSSRTRKSHAVVADLGISKWINRSKNVPAAGGFAKRNELAGDRGVPARDRLLSLLPAVAASDKDHLLTAVHMRALSSRQDVPPLLDQRLSPGRDRCSGWGRHIGLREAHFGRWLSDIVDRLMEAILNASRSLLST